MTDATDLTPPVFRSIFRLKKPPACVLGREDLVSLFEVLEGKGKEGVQLQLAGATPNADQSQEDFEDAKQTAMKDATLSVTVVGTDGEQVYVRSAQDLRTQRLPSRIASVTLGNALRDVPRARGAPGRALGG